MDTISPQQRLDLLPFQPAHVSANSRWSQLQLEDYRNLPPSDLRLQPMTHHIIAFHYKPPQGLLRHRCGGQWKEAQMRQFDLTYVPAFRDNQWQFDGQRPHCFHILLEDAFVRRSIVEMWDVAPEQVDLRARFQSRNRTLQSLAFKLHHALLQSRGQDVLYLESLGLALTTELLGTFSNRLVQPSVSYQLSDAQFGQIVDFLRAHLHLPITLQQMADLLNLSIYHFSRLFRNRTHISPYQFLLRLRLKEAKQLLLNAHSLPLCDIALAVGFADQSHFTRHFRKAFGLTPSVFRLRYGKNVID